MSDEQRTNLEPISITPELLPRGAFVLRQHVADSKNEDGVEISISLPVGSADLLIEMGGYMVAVPAQDLLVGIVPQLEKLIGGNNAKES